MKFIEPMLLLQTDKLPEGSAWLYEIKVDGFRALAGRSGDKILFRSRRDNDFTRKFPYIAKALRALPDERSSTGRWQRSTNRGSRLSISSRTINPGAEC